MEHWASRSFNTSFYIIFLLFLCKFGFHFFIFVHDFVNGYCSSVELWAIPCHFFKTKDQLVHLLVCIPVWFPHKHWMKKMRWVSLLNFLWCLRVLDFVKNRHFLDGSTALETIECDLCSICLGCYFCWRQAGHDNHVLFLCWDLLNCIACQRFY
jgi:hypothetical protein